jgi:hypothetical protein
MSNNKTIDDQRTKDLIEIIQENNKESNQESKKTSVISMEKSKIPGFIQEVSKLESFCFHICLPPNTKNLDEIELGNTIVTRISDKKKIFLISGIDDLVKLGDFLSSLNKLTERIWFEGLLKYDFSLVLLVNPETYNHFEHISTKFAEKSSVYP